MLAATQTWSARRPDHLREGGVHGSVSVERRRREVGAIEMVRLNEQLYLGAAGDHPLGSIGYEPADDR